MKQKLESIQKYYLYFMMYAIFGWLYEVFLEVVVYRWGFSNRGILFGPYCPVYGVGALAFIFTIGHLLKNKTLKQKLILIPVIFVGCMFIATLIELIASYLCEWIIGTWPWQTYADYEYNARKKEQNEEIDRILDKLKKSGYQSLTTEEKKRLFDASRR